MRFWTCGRTRPIHIWHSTPLFAHPSPFFLHVIQGGNVTKPGTAWVHGAVDDLLIPVLPREVTQVAICDSFETGGVGVAQYSTYSINGQNASSSIRSRSQTSQILGGAIRQIMDIHQRQNIGHQGHLLQSKSELIGAGGSIQIDGKGAAVIR